MSDETGAETAPTKFNDPLERAARAYILACEGKHPDPDTATSNLISAADDVAGIVGRKRAAPMDSPTTEAVMRARAVLGDEVKRLRDKATLWRSRRGFRFEQLEADADELESVRRYLLPLDYPSIQEAASPAETGPDGGLLGYATDAECIAALLQRVAELEAEVDAADGARREEGYRND